MPENKSKTTWKVDKSSPWAVYEDRRLILSARRDVENYEEIAKLAARAPEMAQLLVQIYKGVKYGKNVDSKVEINRKAADALKGYVEKTLKVK